MVDLRSDRQRERDDYRRYKAERKNILARRSAMIRHIISNKDSSREFAQYRRWPKGTRKLARGWPVGTLRRVEQYDTTLTTFVLTANGRITWLSEDTMMVPGYRPREFPTSDEDWFDERLVEKARSIAKQFET
jgi:hypothetical protein